jgi:uncharacterized protein YkwD
MIFSARLIAFCAFLAAVCTAGTSSASVGCAIPTDANALATQIAEGLNANRRANARNAVQFNHSLGQAATTHACDMQINGFFAHKGSDGTSLQARVRRTGFKDCLVAENLAWGYPRPEQIVSGWMNSPGHRRNILLADAREFGIGIAQGAKGPIWVLVMARGC